MFLDHKTSNAAETYTKLAKVKQKYTIFHCANTTYVLKHFFICLDIII